MSLSKPVFASVVMAAFVAACGGGAGATISGAVSGLNAGASVTLQNNNSAVLVVSSNGSFSFPTAVDANGTFSVVVVSQPAGQVCSVSSGSGTIDSSGTDITSVTVTCVSSDTVHGTVAGLAPGTSVTLSNAGIVLPIAANGAFAFPGTLAVGASYAVSVAVQPAGQFCTVTNGTGTIGSGGSASVTVTCS